MNATFPGPEVPGPRVGMDADPDIDAATHGVEDGSAAGWQQITMWCSGPAAAEQVALSHLRPALASVRADPGLWWFVRKRSCWRLRLHPTPAGADVLGHLAASLDAAPLVQRLTFPHYEPETAAFGGPAAMQLAHHLFAADSTHLLDHLARVHDRSTPQDQRRAGHRHELGVLLATRLLRGAGLEWYEQADVWQRLVAHRRPAPTDTRGAHPPPAHPPPARPSPATVQAVGTLLCATADQPGSPLHDAPRWGAAFDRAGHQLAEITDAGELRRGLRAVLAHHLLFLFNRLGVTGTDQHTLPAAAAHFAFQEDHHMPTPDPTDTNSSAATSAAVSAVEPEQHPDPDRLRAELADHIRGRGTFHTPRIEQAFRTVPRHRFLPGVDLLDAYAPRPVVLQRAVDGVAVSSASSPNLVAQMLEILDAAPGDRVLEIGTATGINAALLAEIVGQQGAVTSIEIDPGLTDGARRALDATGYRAVGVHCGDGAHGYPDGAPYDRIIITAGAWDIPPAWWEQLAPGGRLVIPIRLHGSGLTRVLPLDLAPHNLATDTHTTHAPDIRPASTETHASVETNATVLVADRALVCGFVPIRGADEHSEDQRVRLAAEVALGVDRADQPDTDALAHALSHDARTAWTGITVSHDEPAQHLDLWLATATDLAPARFGRLRVTPAARRAGAADPALRWAGACLYSGGTLAYITARSHDDSANELGVIAHGPEAAVLADQLRALLARWADERPTEPTITAHRADSPAPTTPGRTDDRAHARVIERPHTRFTVAW